jgi:hypothetical protein
LWERVREPRIRQQFHPIHLMENLAEDADVEEFINEWIQTGM